MISKISGFVELIESFQEIIADRGDAQHSF